MYSTSEITSGSPGVFEKCVSVFLTLSFVFERLAALAGRDAAVIVAALQRFVEAVGPAGQRRQLQADAPTCRLHTRPSHQVLHADHHLPGHRKNLILNTQRSFFYYQTFI